MSKVKCVVCLTRRFIIQLLYGLNISGPLRNERNYISDILRI